MSKVLKKKKKKVLEGKKATLLMEGCKLRLEIKEAELRLKEIQKEMNLRASGTYSNEKGNQLKIVDRSIKSKVCPRDVFKYFRKKGQPQSILDVVTINLDKLKQLMPGEMIDDLQDEVAVNKVWTWET